MGRRLGQHWLADAQTARRIAAAVTPASGQPVLEIGGGRGALTGHLAELGARLTVVEIDPPLAESLRSRFSAATVINADVCQVRLADLAADAPWWVAGNLPYYATSPIVLWLCAQWREVAGAVLLVQDEVADRLAAAPGGKAYGRLSVAVQFRAEVAKLFRVPPGAFAPPPKVWSAVVRLRFRPEPAVAVRDEAGLFALVEHGFRWRRKTLATVLRQWRGEPAETTLGWLAEAGIDPTRRAETLSLAEFARLSDAIAARMS